MSKNYETLLAHIQTLSVIDTHEHLPAFEAKREYETDFLREYLPHYFSSDLISSGMTPDMLERVRDHGKPLMERWKLVEPYWNNARNTGYGRALDYAVRILYEIPGIHSDTVEAVDAAFQESLKPGHFRHVLKDICHIHTAVHHNVNIGEIQCDCEFFRPVFAVNNWVHPTSFDAMIEAAGKNGIRLHRLEDWEQACRSALKKAVEYGAVAIKCNLAYDRTIVFPRPAYADAERAFSEAAAKSISSGVAVRPAPGEAFENHMLHFICRLAEEYGLTFQFHTGLQEGNGNRLMWSHPFNLLNLIHEYPEVNFDLFHIAYPWYMELAALAKQHRNVFIDMCWAHIISPGASVMALSEFLDAVPVNKISAFGGDYAFIDGVVAHLHMAQVNVARVLDNKIELGAFGLDEAKCITEKLFYSNPAALFGIG